MAWNLTILHNTVKVSKEKFDELRKEADKHGHYLGQTKYGAIELDRDANEFMNIYETTWARSILKESDANGTIIFCDDNLNGFGSNYLWGYSFKDGKCTEFEFSSTEMVERLVNN